METRLAGRNAKKWWFVLAAAIGVSGTALKAYQWYFSRPLWLDEQMILLNARDRSFSGLIGALWMDQAAPLGWLALQKAILETFGTGDRAVRALPVLFGIGTIWVAWWLAQRWLHPVTAAVLVALCSISQWMTYYALEVKPYSADAFWALLLPALAVWASEASDRQPIRPARTAIWWCAAFVGQWFSFGATFVTPACALILCGVAQRRSGVRGAAVVAAQGLIWLVGFGAHYTMSMRQASNDDFLRTFWAAGFAPKSAGAIEALRWLLDQAQPLASHPGSTGLWIAFWSSAAYGFAVLIARRPIMGLIALSVPLSACVLALFHVVPFTDRLALWTTPALYLGIATAAGHLFEHIGAPRSRRWLASGAVALVFAFGAWTVVRDIVEKGNERVITAGDNHGLDDGRGIRLLMHQRQPGDVLLATHMSLPALWWYGGINTDEEHRGQTVTADGGPILEIRHTWFASEGCRRTTRLRMLSEALAGASRAAVYLGFGSDVPEGFQLLVLDDLGRLGLRVFYSRVAAGGVAAIYDLKQPPEPALANAPAVPGCVGVRAAERW